MILQVLKSFLSLMRMLSSVTSIGTGLTRLQISVDNMLLMNVGNCSQDTFDQSTCLLSSEAFPFVLAFLDQVSQPSILDELHTKK